MGTVARSTSPDSASTGRSPTTEIVPRRSIDGNVAPGAHGGSHAIVARARSSTSAMKRPARGTSVGLTWVTVTVTDPAPTATATPSGASVVTRRAAAPAAAGRIGGDAGGPGRLPSGQLEGQLVPPDERHLEQAEQEHHHQREEQRHLDARLAPFAPAPALTPCR